MYLDFDIYISIHISILRVLLSLIYLFIYMQKKLDGNYTKILCVVLNKS